MSFSLRQFGGVSIEGPRGPLTGRAAQRHRLVLLAMLAASTRGGLTRDKLIAYPWPDSDDERARRSLSDSIYRINKALDEDTVLTPGVEVRRTGCRATWPVGLSDGSGITVAALAYARAAGGDLARAREMLRRLEAAAVDGEYQPTFEIAKVYVALREPEEAIRWLGRAFEKRSHSMVFLQVDPQLAGLARHADFRRLVERVGLTHAR